MTTRRTATRPPATENTPRHFAVVGAGLAGIACARTLVQAGHRVTLLEAEAAVGGRMATRETPFGTFDHGAQYFTVRDARFAQALETVPGLCKPWSATMVRVLDTFGRVAAAGLANGEPHWVATPGMDALPRRWAVPLAGATELETRVTHIERDSLNPRQWQLRTLGSPGAPDARHVFSGFDAVLLAVPHPHAVALLQNSALVPALAKRLGKVEVVPCWTLMLAFPQATTGRIGPQWNAARSTHHRIAWLARESSKPRRGSVERWTVQASPAWSLEHLDDDAPRVLAKLCKAFSEVTGVRAEPTHAEVFRWTSAQTTTPLGQTHLWDAKAGIGVAGDWCIGHRVEDAFISGLELAPDVL